MNARGFLAGVGLSVAVFVGVAGALQFDKWTDRRHESDSQSIFSQPDIRPVANDQQIGAVPDFRAAAHKVIPSVVSVDRYERVSESFFDDVGSVQETAQGSGVIISGDGLIVTNNHVVAGAEQVKVRTPDKRTFTAKVLGRDPRSDIAVIKIDAHGLQPVELGGANSIQ